MSEVLSILLRAALLLLLIYVNVEIVALTSPWSLGWLLPLSGAAYFANGALIDHSVKVVIGCDSPLA